VLEFPIEHGQFKRLDRRAHVAEALTPWDQAQSRALVAVLERLQPDPVELFQRLSIRQRS
jgi:hypothetical protein